MEASADKAKHNQATEADDFESRVAEAVESRLAEAVEKHIQATRAKAVERLMQSMKLKYPKKPVGRFCVSNLKAIQDLRGNLMAQVSQTIREAPKEIHDAYRQAYYKAIEEYDERVKNKPPSDQDEGIDQDERFEKIRDEQLSLARIEADKIIRDEQIRADQIRASYRKANTKDVGNQSGQVDPENVNVDLAAMLSVKGTFKESDIEKQISKRQATAQLMAEQCIAAAHIKADKIIEYNKTLLALKREKCKKIHRDPGEGRKYDEAVLGFKDNLSP